MAESSEAQKRSPGFGKPDGSLNVAALLALGTKPRLYTREEEEFGEPRPEVFEGEEEDFEEEEEESEEDETDFEDFASEPKPAPVALPASALQIVSPAVASGLEAMELLYQKHAVVDNYGGKTAVLSWEPLTLTRVI